MLTDRQQPSRRKFLKTALVSAAASSLLPGALIAAPEARRGFRVVQISDTHVEEEQHARHLISLLNKVIKEEKPDIIIHTGDVIMDALSTNKEKTSAQWKLWKQIIAASPTPMYYCLGNHDVWWDISGKDDPLYGKAWAVNELQLPGRYYSAKQHGWHFIFLDSIQPHPTTTYVGKLDEEQLNWLRNDLQELPADIPVLICSHIPFLSASVYELINRNNGGDRVVSGSLMHDDTLEIQALLRKHPNVKGCISGHIHLEDHIIYDHVQYMGCTAVSGNWWADSIFHQTTAGYAVLDLSADGRINRQYKIFDWKKM